MNNARRTSGLFWLTLAATFTACGGVTLEEMCQRHSEECGEDPEREQACIQSGQIFRDQAEEKGCAGAFDAYIDCVANSGDICDEAAVVEECGLLEDGVPVLERDGRSSRAELALTRHGERSFVGLAATHSSSWAFGLHIRSPFATKARHSSDEMGCEKGRYFLSQEELVFHSALVRRRRGSDVANAYGVVGGLLN